MTKSMLKAATCLTAISVATGSFAGGLDRATFNPGVLYEEDNYFELSFGHTNPSVGTYVAGPRITVAPSFQTIQAAYKHQFSDKFALGLMVNSNPFGVDITYASLGSPLAADLGANSLIALGKYQINENVSAYGGLRYTETSGTANLTPLGVPEILSVDGSGVDFIVGASYEIPKIALRASLTYESGTELDPDVSGESGTAYGVGQINVPEAITLNFQTGVAPDTLAFATIRHAKWEDAQVVLPASLGSTPVSSFDNSTAFNIGVARKISDAFAVSASLSYEASSGDPVSPLSPTDGIRGISVGGKYTAPNGLETSIGLSYSKRGDATTTTGIPFSGNEVITAGIKFGKSF